MQFWNLKKKYKRINFLIYGTKDHFLSYPFKLLANCFISLYYYFKYHPDYVITTGAHTAGPMCYLGKIFGSKIIFIETFANSKTKSKPKSKGHRFAETKAKKTDRDVISYEDVPLEDYELEKTDIMLENSKKLVSLISL